MKMSPRVRITRRVLAVTAVAMCVTAGAWAGETVLYSFPGLPGGANPFGSLARDSAGNLYGTTVYGGSTTPPSCGIVFELSPAAGGGYTPSALYKFQSSQVLDGCLPESGLIFDSAGNLYGTTTGGGGSNDFGTVYELIPGADGSWAEKILWYFTGGDDGANPRTGVVFDSQGNLYGTTSAGGNQNCSFNTSDGCGTVYELTPTASGEWTEATLYEFRGVDSGLSPGPVAIDDQGNLFGTTFYGGPPPRSTAACNSELGCGVVFQLMRGTNGSFEYRVIYAFAGTSATDGGNPTGVVISNAAHLFGATVIGGTAGDGTVWELSHSGSGWSESILYNFQGGTDAANPVAPLLLGDDRVLYGTALGGGGYARCGNGCGALFRVANSVSGWSEKVLFRFDDSDGDEFGVYGNGLIQDPAGNLYGLTNAGGSSHNGVVFEFTMP